MTCSNHSSYTKTHLYKIKKTNKPRVSFWGFATSGAGSAPDLYHGVKLKGCLQLLNDSTSTFKSTAFQLIKPHLFTSLVNISPLKHSLDLFEDNERKFSRLSLIRNKFLGWKKTNLSPILGEESAPISLILGDRWLIDTCEVDLIHRSYLTNIAIKLEFFQWATLKAISILFCSILFI